MVAICRRPRLPRWLRGCGVGTLRFALLTRWRPRRLMTTTATMTPVGTRRSYEGSGWPAAAYCLDIRAEDILWCRGRWRFAHQTIVSSSEHGERRVGVDRPVCPRVNPYARQV